MLRANNAWRRGTRGLAFLVALAASHAFPQGLAEYQVKAAFLFNFARYTEWPSPGAGGQGVPFSVCIIGRDPFGDALAAIEGKIVHDRPLRVHRGVALDQLRGCQLLWVSESEERRLAAILRAVAPYPVMTLSDIEGFVEAGGMIGLMVVEERVRFDVNLAAVRQANLHVSSQVLKLARNVTGVKG